MQCGMAAIKMEYRGKCVTGVFLEERSADGYENNSADGRYLQKSIV